MLSYSGTVTASGDSQLIAAPTTGYIRVYGVQVSSRSAITEVQLKSGTSNVKWITERLSVAGGGDGVSPGENELFNCAAASGLFINLAASGTAVAANVQYEIQSST